MEKRFLISGGGTGGHIFPAIAIANEIKRRMPEAKILFVGAENRMEMEKVPAAGYEIKGLPVYGLDRRNLLRNIKVVVKLMQSMGLAKKILREFAPDVAVGVGGYASGPMLKTAQRRGIPTLLQEQNSYAGVTNKLLAKRATAICVAYDGMERFFPAEKIVKTGNPIRRALLECGLTKEEARASLGLHPRKRTILAVGGSLGARTINNSIIAALPLIAGRDDVQLIWQTGKYYEETTSSALEQSGATNVARMQFIANMEAAYRAADLVVSRAGAGSISELQQLGIPAILVPSPLVAEDHQTKNAMALADRHAAVMVTDADAETTLGGLMLTLACDEERLAKLAKNISAMAMRDADTKIVDQIFRIIR